MEDAIVAREHILCSLCNVHHRTAVTFLMYRLYVVEGHYLHSTVYIARYGLRVAFVWLCKSQTIEDHVLYHATVVSRCAS